MIRARFLGDSDILVLVGALGSGFLGVEVKMLELEQGFGGTWYFSISISI